MTLRTLAYCTLSLHDALPICEPADRDQHVLRDSGLDEQDGDGGHVGAEEEEEAGFRGDPGADRRARGLGGLRQDRKSTRLNSSHRCISYAVFCLKNKID